MTTMDEVAGPPATIGGLVLIPTPVDDGTHCARHRGWGANSLTPR